MIPKNTHISFDKVLAQTEKLFDTLPLTMEMWERYLESLTNYGWTQQDYMDELEKVVSAEWIRIHGASICLN